MSTDKPQTPTLKPVLFIDLELDGVPRPVINNKAKSINVAIVKQGTITSTDPNYPFDAKVNFGFDDLTTESTGTISGLDCKLYLTSTKSGKGIFCSYSGVVQLNEKVGGLLLSDSENLLSYDDAYVTCHPKFQLDDDVEKESRWVLDHNYIGKGRFIRDATGALKVQYQVYILA